MVGGGEAMVRGGEATVRGGEATVRGAEAMVRGGEAMVRGAEAMVRGGEATSGRGEATGAGLPWRSSGGSDAACPVPLALPPAPMPMVRRRRPLKRWRYVAVFDERVMLCAGSVWVGPLRQTFWAVWDRAAHRLHERTRVVRHGGVELTRGRLRIRDGGVRVELALDEQHGVVTVCPHGKGYVWTRKQGGVVARGKVAVGSAPALELRARAIVDDTAGYHERLTEWRWCAGIGDGEDGAALAWNLVEGVNDPARESERTVWRDGAACEVPPVVIAGDLSAVVAESGAELRFTPEAERRRRDRLLLASSSYRQPFGSFGGVLPDGSRLSRGLGVMECHRAKW